MNYKAVALAGVATIALMGTSLAATTHHQRHHQTRATQSAKDAEEAKITAQLNQQQLASVAGATTVAGAATGGATATTAAPDTMRTAEDESAGKASAAAEGTPGKSPQPAEKASEPGMMNSTAAMPTQTNTDTAITNAELKSGTTLSSAEVQPEVVKTAELRTKDGQMIGSISSVNMGAGGKIASVNADVGGFLGVGQRTVMIDAASLVYLKDRNVVVAKLTKDELNKLPPAASP